MIAVSRPIERHYDVQTGTGAVVSTIPAGAWYRGVVYRGMSPTVQPIRPHVMYDPTDPRTWPQ